MANYVLGFDIGGTKCAVLLASVENGIQLLDRICFPTETEKGFAHAKGLLFAAGHEILQRAGVEAEHLLAVGVSCGGPLDSRRGVILSPPHLPGWDNIPITEMIEREFGVRAFLQNDANACALVEWKMGAGRGAQNMVFLTMGTGFGAGIIAAGRLVEGASGLAGEVGHIRLENDGPIGFGKPGSVEVYCSGAGVASTAREYTTALQQQGRTPAWVADGLAPEELNAKLIADYAEKGDADAIEIYRQVGENLGKILSILIDLLNPECIVIGSIFVRSEKLLRPAMEKMLQAEALPGALRDCRILPAATGEALGDYASILAACYQLDIDAAPQQPPTKQSVLGHYERLFQRHPELEAMRDDMMKAFMALRRAFGHNKKLLTCGNGGSAMDAGHIVGELMKGFYLPRALDEGAAARFGSRAPRMQSALPAIDLTQHTALSTAFMNDVDPAMVFAQQVYGYGRRGDVLLCISTSGNAQNVLNAAKTAHALGMAVIGLTGEGGGKLAAHCDVLLAAPATVTADVQELHLPMYHTLCAMLEAEFFSEE